MAEGTPIPDIHAKIAGKELVSMANHLTEQRRAEVTMDDVSIQMRAIVEAAVDAIIIIDEI